MQTDRTRTLLMAIIATIMVGGVLYFARPVVLPLVLAIFFALLVRPAYHWMRRFVPSAVAMTVVVLGVAMVLVAVPLTFATNVQAVIDRWPEYAPRVDALAQWLHDLAADYGIDLDMTLSDPATVDALLSFATGWAKDLASFAATIILMLFTMIFVILEADVIRAKLVTVFGEEDAEQITQSAHSMRVRVTQYVATKTLVSTLNGTAAGLITWALGVDFPFVWAVLTFVLNYVPNFGLLIALVPPVLIALIQFQTPTIAIATLVTLLVVFNLVGNILEPRLLGRALSLSPLVVFLSLLFWGWYWGFIGVVLSVPLTVGIRIVCEHIEVLRPVAVLIGDGTAPKSQQDVVET
jgi:AI-2 transport protein TqsA